MLTYMNRVFTAGMKFDAQKQKFPTLISGRYVKTATEPQKCGYYLLGG